MKIEIKLEDSRYCDDNCPYYMQECSDDCSKFKKKLDGGDKHGEKIGNYVYYRLKECIKENGK